VSGQQHAPAALYPRERPGTHCTGGWVGPRVGLDVRKYLVPTGIRSRTFQPVAQSLYQLSYPAHNIYIYTYFPYYCLTQLQFRITHLPILLWCVDNHDSWRRRRRGFIQDQIELNCTCEVLKAVCGLRRGRHTFDLPCWKAVLSWADKRYCVLQR